MLAFGKRNNITNEAFGNNNNGKEVKRGKTEALGKRNNKTSVTPNGKTAKRESENGRNGQDNHQRQINTPL